MSFHCFKAPCNIIMFTPAVISRKECLHLSFFVELFDFMCKEKWEKNKGVGEGKQFENMHYWL